MSQSPLVYEAHVYTQTVKYKNFKGEVTETELQFALDPLELMHLIAGFQPKTIKSGNPAKNGTQEVTEEQTLKFVRDIACKAAGFASDDGETWEPFEDFSDKLVGKAFLTKLTSSDGDRKDFAEKVLLAPFRAFVEYAKADESNSRADVQGFEKMMQELENIFKVPEQKPETMEEKRARLAAEMAALESPAGTTGQVGLGE